MTRTIAVLHDRLLAARNADGGWGYYEGKASRLEPTCWAMLYSQRIETLHGARATSVNWLARRQQADGLLVDVAMDLPNLAFNGLAALVLLDGETREDPLQRLIAGLNRVKGRRVRNTSRSGQDSTLQGWPWIDGTFSWVEPTSWCLLALKKASSGNGFPEAAARIQEAERLLLDRVNQTGGWNYGNSNVLDQDLAAYVPTTALGLLALQDRAEHPLVRKSLEYLTEHRLSERAGMALALTSISLRTFGVPAPEVDEHLLALAERDGFFGNLHIIAMALFALGGEEHGAATFRL